MSSKINQPDTVKLQGVLYVRADLMPVDDVKNIITGLNDLRHGIFHDTDAVNHLLDELIALANGLAQYSIDKNSGWR